MFNLLMRAGSRFGGNLLMRDGSRFWGNDSSGCAWRCSSSSRGEALGITESLGVTSPGKWWEIAFA